jgi:hydroxylaminobenzene mutase
MSDTFGRRMIFQGMLLFLIGLLMGPIILIAESPITAVAGHVGALMTATFMIAVGAIWERFSLSPQAAAIAFWTLVYSAYANAIGVTLAALWGAGQALPIAAAGSHASPIEEVIVSFFVVTGVPTVLAAVVILLWGLTHAPRATAGRH